MFGIEATKILEIVARVSIIYIACMILLRVSGRREMSQLGPMDLLTMLLLSETVSPALTGGDESVSGNLVAAAVLVALATSTSWLAMRSDLFNRAVEGRSQLLIRDGRVIGSVMRKYRITDEDLRLSLHDAGVLNVHDVARAYVEPDGHISIIKQEDFEQSRKRHHKLEPKEA
jgi:uncharacterized membrane protein YcaP (DUF421 family)